VTRTALSCSLFDHRDRLPGQMRIHDIFGILLIVLITVAGTACTRPTLSWQLADPVMYVNQIGDCDSGAINCDFASGLLLAVWADGRVLRTETGDTIGFRYILGSPPAEGVAALLAAVAELGLLPSVEVSKVTADVSHHVVVAGRDGLRRTWVFAIPVREPLFADIEERLVAIMETELEDARSIHWSELPRFDAPVTGNWRIVRQPDE